MIMMIPSFTLNFAQMTMVFWLFQLSIWIQPSSISILALPLLSSLLSLSLSCSSSPMIPVDNVAVDADVDDDVDDDVEFGDVSVVVAFVAAVVIVSVEFVFVFVSVLLSLLLSLLSLVKQHERHDSWNTCERL